MKQQIFGNLIKLGEKEFGGSLLKGHAREARPISYKKTMHLVMRSGLAVGPRSFLNRKNASVVKELIQRVAKLKGVKVYRYANSGNHLHLVLLPMSRRAFAAFIRSVSGLIARHVLGVERGRALGKKFWDARPYTKIIEWGKEYKNVCRYVLQNTLEAIGFIDYQPQKKKHSSA